MSEQTFTESDIREAMAEWLEHETIDQGQAAADSFMKHLTRPKIEFAEGEWVIDMYILSFSKRDKFIDPIAQPLENMSQQMRNVYKNGRAFIDNCLQRTTTVDEYNLMRKELIRSFLAFEQHHGIGGK